MINEREAKDLLVDLARKKREEVITVLNEKYRMELGRDLPDDKIENLKNVVIPALGFRRIADILSEDKKEIEENEDGDEKEIINIDGLMFKNLLKEDNNYWRVYDKDQDLSSAVIEDVVQKAIKKQGLSKSLIVLSDEETDTIYLKRYPLV